LQKRPVVSGADLIKLMTGLGYRVVRQKGSHVRLKCQTAAGEHAITIPLHNEIAKGTLNDIISKVSLWKSIPKEKLLKILGEI